MRLRNKIRQELSKLEVGVLYLIGSQTRGVPGPMSDIDLAVVFSNVERPTNPAEPHTILYELLTDEFPVTMTNDVDIIYLQETSLSFQFEAISTGRVLYECDPEFRADYEESVVKDYLDFVFLEKTFSEALMERLS
jgi:predicted nucleotidyltransferase